MRGHSLAADVTVHPLNRRDQDGRFEREALPWLDDVYRFALSLTRDEADAEDVVQDTFLRAYKSWHTYEPESDCRRWLFTICRNVFLRAREKDRTTVELADSEVDVMAASTLFFEALRSGFEDVHARVDLAPALADALAKLPEPFRSTVLIVDVEDQPYEAAAEILGVPIGTVRSRLFRGRRILQEQLLAFARDAGLAQQGARSQGQPHD
jgi:RNA polymerase sigma-70 factor, ECF subfamily